MPPENTPAPVAGTPATETTKKKGGAPKAADRVAPVIAAVRADITPPKNVTTRGQKSPITVEMEKLEVGQSFGLMNKTKKDIQSRVSNFNNAESNLRTVTDANGATVWKTAPVPAEPITDAAGNVVATKPAVAGVPKTEPVKYFEVHDMDPKKDPDKATVRIFRIR